MYSVTMWLPNETDDEGPHEVDDEADDGITKSGEPCGVVGVYLSELKRKGSAKSGYTTISGASELSSIFPFQSKMNPNGRSRFGKGLDGGTRLVAAGCTPSALLGQSGKIWS